MTNAKRPPASDKRCPTLEELMGVNPPVESDASRIAPENPCTIPSVIDDLYDSTALVEAVQSMHDEISSTWRVLNTLQGQLFDVIDGLESIIGRNGRGV